MPPSLFLNSWIVQLSRECFYFIGFKKCVVVFLLGSPWKERSVTECIKRCSHVTREGRPMRNKVVHWDLFWAHDCEDVGLENGIASTTCSFCFCIQQFHEIFNLNHKVDVWKRRDSSWMSQILSWCESRSLWICHNISNRGNAKLKVRKPITLLSQLSTPTLSLFIGKWQNLEDPSQNAHYYCYYYSTFLNLYF